MTKIRAKTTAGAVYAVPPHSVGDTPKVIGLPAEHNVRVEKIDNGYLKTESKWGEDGSHSHTKTFHPTHPGLSAEKPKVGPSPLRAAVNHLKGKKK